MDIQGKTKVAGLDAVYLGVIESQGAYYGLITVFRMPAASPREAAYATTL